MDQPARRVEPRILEADGPAQLIATHDLDFAERVCTRVILLEDGTLDRGAPTILHVRKRWTGA